MAPTTPPCAIPDARSAGIDATEIARILAGVPDPEIPAVSVLDLGIVREIGADRVTITPTYTGCPATLAFYGCSANWPMDD